MQEECRQAVKELRDVAFGLVLLYPPGVAQLHPNSQQGTPAWTSGRGLARGYRAAKGPEEQQGDAGMGEEGSVSPQLW